MSYAVGSNPIQLGASFLNIFRGANSPEPEIVIEAKTAAEIQTLPALYQGDPSLDWPNYNRTLKGDRFSRLDQINTENASKVVEICSYSTKLMEGNQTGLLMVDGALIATTSEDIFSIDAATCEENWRVKEDTGLGIMPVNRGPAYMDGKLFRGYPDGYVRAYDSATGEKLWETYIADENKSLWLNAAPIAWNGMLFYGTAGGDIHGIRGRVFGMNAETGEIKWQTFTVPQQDEDVVHAPLGSVPDEEMRASWRNPPTVPITGGGVWTAFSLDPETGYLYVPVGNPAPDFVKTVREGSNLFTNTMLVLDTQTGNYVKHYEIMKNDWHDWDMSNPPIFYTTRAGREQMSFHPKDGHLYAYDMSNDAQIYRNPVTKMLNTDVEFVPGVETYFCPGSVGGGEWNSAAYDPMTNIIFTGENEWCASAKIKTDEEAEHHPEGAIWFGVDYFNPYALVGKTDPPSKWGGWLYASDADTGEWAWRARTNYPIVAAVTPTAGGIVMFGDLGGQFHIHNASTGDELLNLEMHGPMAGGLITYMDDDKQYIAVMSGVEHPQWPVQPKVNKVVVLGIPEE